MTNNEIKLLLVDDEVEFREATGQALKRRGFAVTLADSGEQALALIRSSLPDIIVLDLKMEGMDGIDTLVEVRKVNKDLPVVILTGHGGFDDAMAGIRLEIVDFLQKPVDVAHLAARIRSLLNRRRRGPLKERSIGELMVPASAYRRVHSDQPVREVIGLMRDELFRGEVGKVTEQGRRTVLVYDRNERFVGCLRLTEILELALPSFLRDTPYASFFTGMFVAQCKIVGKQPVGELTSPAPRVEIDAPLMEALHLMVSERVINLPVFRNGELVGILRDKDLLLEIANLILGDGD
jgi:CheY-like chemotaxis protein